MNNIDDLPNKFDIIWNFLKENEDFTHYLEVKFPNLTSSKLKIGDYVTAPNMFKLGVITCFNSDSTVGVLVCDNPFCEINKNIDFLIFKAWDDLNDLGNRTDDACVYLDLNICQRVTEVYIYEILEKTKSGKHKKGEVGWSIEKNESLVYKWIKTVPIQIEVENYFW